jgi:RHS repeat-associated protein
MRSQQQGQGIAVRLVIGASVLLLAASLAHAAVPTAPTNLVATAISPGQVNLSWTDNSNNEAFFLVERKTGSAGTYAQIASLNPNVVTFGDTGLTASTTYFYRVRASNSSGNSAYTNQASVTTPAGDATPPTAPTGLTATAVSGSQINLGWTAATDNVAVAGYRVEQCSSGLFITCGIEIGATTGTTFSHTGLGEYTLHIYRVRAVDAAGNFGPYTNTVGATTLDVTAPTAPTALTATAASASQINLSWTGSSDTGTGVKGYQVERCQGAACSAFVQMAFVQAGPPSFIDTGLAAATYRYQIRASDNAGNLSAYSNIVSATTSSAADTTAPSAPMGLTATAAISNQLNLSWTSSTDNIGVTGYRVERCQGAGCTAFAQVAAPTATSFNDTGLARATTYRYRVRSTDAASNLSAYSSVVSATTLNVADTTPPTAPSFISTDTVSASQVNVSWTPSTDNTGVTGYRLERCGPTSTTIFCVASGGFVEIAAPTGISFSDTGLSPKMLYMYRVRATDAAGNLSTYSGVATAQTLDTSAPSTPTGLTATAASPSRINLSWTASTDSTGVTGYRVERCQGAGCINFSQVTTPTGTSFSDSSLTAGTSYRYRVLAVNTAGSVSAYSNIASATTPFVLDTTPPTAPAGLTATTAGTSQINLSWTASSDDIGVTGYQVDRCQGASCTTFAQVGTPTVTSFNDIGLTPSTSYSYRVRATDAAGNISANSSIATATTQAPPDTTAPSAPTGLAATVASTTQINLTWTASTDNVGVTGYRVERCQGMGCTNFVEIAAPTATSFSNTGLTAATSYSYRVRATDAAGNLSGYSNVVSATTGTGQVQAYYIHPDHLNTPRLIANSTGTTVWRWDQGEPFGNDVPNNNPSGLGAFDFPLRLPGQYYDKDTALHYNTMRDYDPSIGRYVESDPIGLDGGLNTYLYVVGDPISNTDPDGLRGPPGAGAVPPSRGLPGRAPRIPLCVRWMCKICGPDSPPVCPPIPIERCTTFFVDAPPGHPGSGGFAGPGGYAGDAKRMPECMCIQFAPYPF